MNDLSQIEDRVTPITESRERAWTRDGIRLGFVTTIPMALGVAAYGVVFGVLARQVNLTFLETVAINVFVFAGAAQLAGLEHWHYPLPIAGIVVTVLLINLRLIMLGASMRPWLGRVSPWFVYPTLHTLCDESWAVMMTLYRQGKRDPGIVLGANLAIVAAWQPSVIVGYLIGGRVGDPAAIGLDFAFTAVFAAMLFSGYRGRYDLLPWTASGVVAFIVWKMLPDTNWYVIAGGLAGLAVAILTAPIPSEPHDIDGDMP